MWNRNIETSSKNQISSVTKVYCLMKKKIERHQYEKRISCGKRGMRPNRTVAAH